MSIGAIHAWKCDVYRGHGQERCQATGQPQKGEREEKEEKKTLESTSHHSENSVSGWIGLNIKGKTITFLDYRRLFFLASS